MSAEDRSSDDLTYKLADIVKANKKIRDALDSNAIEQRIEEVPFRF